ncbi:hypothetical protein An07g05710 [Aspergillus niger]|uniref:Uncharacterized protein n=3 Tax=Aspergillus niger TaxID=5061 RepID=E2PSN5_ASPNC|nr:hypothetical protein An07g05710 [Aspergillus niger]CAK48942.1 hypothetical protein An07g05710 [Aspergillus niger]
MGTNPSISQMLHAQPLSSVETEDIHLPKQPTMRLATLACFCISAASAVKHYGMDPSEDTRNLIEEHARKLLDNDMRLVSVFTTDYHHTHDGSDFLSSEMGIFNKTISEIFVSSTHGSSESALEVRDNINGKCQGHGRIEDNLSDFQIKMICGAISQAAGGGVSAIIEVIESNLCTEAGTGHPVPSCKTIVGFIKTTSAGFTGLEINNYCPDFMSLFVKCKGSDAKAFAEDKKIEMTAFNSQKDYNCDNAGVKCIEASV